MRDLYNVKADSLEGPCILTGIDGVVIEPNIDRRYTPTELVEWAKRFNSLYTILMSSIDPAEALLLRCRLHLPCHKPASTVDIAPTIGDCSRH